MQWGSKATALRVVRNLFCTCAMKEESLCRTKNKENRKNDEGQPPEIRRSKEGMIFFISSSAAAKI
jgi:hypothetical protein